jgi:hypothetical protein
MEITGTIVDMLAVVGGTNGSGKEWKKQEIIIEVPGQYTKKVAVTVWNDKVDSGLAIGHSVTVHINLESKEYNGRWFTNLKAWKIDRNGYDYADNPAADPQNNYNQDPGDFTYDESDDIPF